MKRTISVCIAMAALAAVSHAQVTEVYTGGLLIPDGRSSGVTSSLQVQGLAPVLTAIQVSLSLSPAGDGGFAGDLYVTLLHEGRMAVLLNRPGADLDRPGGYGDSVGIQVTLDDLGAADIHHYRVAVMGSADVPLTVSLQGTWQPDGRDEDPGGDVWAAPRSRMLGTFLGTNPNGTWTLFAADLSTGATFSLDAWSIQVTAVPEPEWAVTATACLMGLWTLRRLRNRARTSA